MISLSEICHRASTGDIVDEETFDLDIVYRTAEKLCKKYGIVYDPENPVPSDDEMADRLFHAAVDFISDVGVYCPDTKRIIKFTREEIQEAVANSSGRCVMGEGKDRYVWTPRLPDSDTKPWFHVGTGIINTDERVAFNLAEAYAGITQANSISAPALDRVDGYMVEAGKPTEILGAIRGVTIARNALMQAGRPGLAIGNCISTAVTPLATIAASAPQFGLRPSDGWLIGAKAEMKFTMDALNKAAYLSNWGANICCEFGPLVGGYGGGPAGVAILSVTYVLAGLLVLNCDYHLMFPIYITKGCSTNREALWCASVSAQAISRNTKELVWSLGYIAAGPMTKQFFYESAAYIMSAISSGLSTQTCHPAKAVLNDYITPMEMLGTVELAQACVGMKRDDASKLVKMLLRKYEDTIDTAPVGKKYQECYDIDTGQSSQEYVDLYGEVKEEFRVLGVM